VATPTLARPTPTGSTQNRSSRRLSEVTKKLAYPRRGSPVLNGATSAMSSAASRWASSSTAGRTGSGKFCWRRMSDGILVHTVGGLHLSVCRQAGKTYFYAGALFGLVGEIRWPADHLVCSSLVRMTKRLRRCRDSLPARKVRSRSSSGCSPAPVPRLSNSPTAPASCSVPASAGSAEAFPASTY
jgi:hypothetical protein